MELIADMKTLIARCLKLQILLLGSILLSFTPAQANTLDHLRDLVQKWVETERLISEEEQAWQENKAEMGDLLTALGKEEKILKEKIKATKNLTLSVDKERVDLLKERSEYRDVSQLLKTEIKNYERQIITLYRGLPDPLQQELSPQYQKLNAGQASENTSPSESLSVRLRAVISMMTQIQKFDNSVTLVKDIRQTKQGTEVEVDILYLGLTQAYYVDKKMQQAGIGVPTAEGWRWTEQLSLAQGIKEATDIYEGRNSPDLIQLPLTLNLAGMR